MRYLVPILFVLAACSSTRMPNNETAAKEDAKGAAAAAAPAGLVAAHQVLLGEILGQS